MLICTSHSNYLGYYAILFFTELNECFPEKKKKQKPQGTVVQLHVCVERYGSKCYMKASTFFVAYIPTNFDAEI